MVRKEVNSIRDADGFCSWDVALIVTVMMIGWSNVESLGSVVSPGWAFSCPVMNTTLHPAGANGVSLKLKLQLICA